MEKTYLNRLELLSEIFNLSLYYFMFIFTNFVPDIKTRYSLGFYFMYQVVAIASIMILSAIVDMAKSFHFKYKVHKANKKWVEFEKIKLQMLDFIIADSFARTEHQSTMSLSVTERLSHRIVLQQHFNFQ